MILHINTSTSDKALHQQKALNTTPWLDQLNVSKGDHDYSVEKQEHYIGGGIA